MKVRPAESADLRVGVGKQPALQQRVIGEVDARHNVARAERDLLGLGKEIVRITVQGHFAQRRDRHDFFGDQLGRVEDVEIEVVLVFLLDDLYAEFPFRVVAHLDRFPEVATVVVSVFTGELLRFVPHQRASTGSRAPVEFDEARFALGVDQPESVHAEALHAAQAFRDRPVRHRPDDHVRRLRHQRNKVPEGIVRRATGRDFIVRLGFHCVDEVGKLDRVLNEEDRHVVADQIEVAFVGEKFHGKTAYVAHGIT